MLSESIEGAEGESLAGREQVMTLLRAWQPILAQAMGRGGGVRLVSRVFARNECTPSLCRDVYLREGDLLLRLDHPALNRRSFSRGLRGAAGARGQSDPPRYFVLREIGGRLRVVAMNDEFIRGA